MLRISKYRTPNAEYRMRFKALNTDDTDKTDTH